MQRRRDAMPTVATPATADTSRSERARKCPARYSSSTSSNTSLPSNAVTPNLGNTAPVATNSCCSQTSSADNTAEVTAPRRSHKKKTTALTAAESCSLLSRPPVLSRSSRVIARTLPDGQLDQD
eukprot:6184073-Pleurochrysis_carterae.AAC.1